MFHVVAIDIVVMGLLLEVSSFAKPKRYVSVWQRVLWSMIKKTGPAGQTENWSKQRAGSCGNSFGQLNWKKPVKPRLYRLTPSNRPTRGWTGFSQVS